MCANACWQQTNKINNCLLLVCSVCVCFLLYSPWYQTIVVDWALNKIWGLGGGGISYEHYHTFSPSISLCACLILLLTVFELFPCTNISSAETWLGDDKHVMHTRKMCISLRNWLFQCGCYCMCVGVFECAICPTQIDWGISTSQSLSIVEQLLLIGIQTHICSIY